MAFFYKCHIGNKLHPGAESTGNTLNKNGGKNMTKQTNPITRSTLRCCQNCVQYFDCPGGGADAVMCFPSVEKQYKSYN